jgi:predicted SAM-dependent methyltransferase
MNTQQDVIKVVVGSGTSTNNLEWIHTQEDELNLLKREDWETKFTRNSIHAIVAEHVWEHLTYDDGIEAARICYDYLNLG